MLLYYAYVNTSRYITITNLDKKPLKSSKTFQNTNECVLYDILTDYINHYQTSWGYENIVKILHNYSFRPESNSKTNVSILEIKLLLVTNILHKFKIGEFDINMLELAQDFDDNLMLHYETICSYSFFDVRRSMRMEYIHYQLDNYKINKSVSFFTLTYIALMFELVLYQIEHNKWFWEAGDYFEEHIGELLPHIDHRIRFVFDEKECYYTRINLAPIEFFYKLFYYYEAELWVLNTEGQHYYLYPVYSLVDVLEAIEEYNKTIQFPAGMSSREKILGVFKENPNLQNLCSILKKLYTLSHIERTYLESSGAPKYIFFFNNRGEVCDNDTLDKWKKDTLNYAEQLNATDTLICDWMRAVHH